MPDDETPQPHAPYGPLPEGGTVRAITRWGTPVMHRPQAAVTAYDDTLRSLAADMVATMYAADGVGLAACQVGEDVAMFVFDCPDDEGCLSFPGSFEPCARPDWARVDGTGLDGQPVSFEGSGLLARCLQHETDHTLGTVFGDRLSAKSRKKLGKKHDAAADDYPLAWPAESA
jgi:peptide deformylase